MKSAEEKLAPAGVVRSGIRKCSTAHARVGLASAALIAKKEKKCSAHIFVDVKSAFTSFVREVLFCSCRGAGNFDRVLEELGFGGDLIGSVMEEIVGYADFEVNVDRVVLFFAL